MPVLRAGEKMQRCEFEDHAQMRRQKYYIRRKYYNELEQHFCPGCCGYLQNIGLVKFTDDGYVPTGDRTIEKLLNIYGNGVKNA